jgi:thiamine biosynthesis protein ThiI
MIPHRPCVIVHYHEISLKRGNRPLFLRRLQENIARAVGDLGPVSVHQLPGRIVIDLAGHPAPEAVRTRLDRVCGVANTALAVRTGSSLEALRAAVDHVIEGVAFPSFRITARRAFKTFPLTSTDLNRELGAHVQRQRPEARVDLHHAAFEIHVEVLPREAFVYPDRRPGPGGLPVGSAGTVGALISGGIDSPVAAWRMMKRGCRVLFVHFHSVPYLPDASVRKVRELVARLTQWQYFSRLHVVPFGEIQREVVLSVSPMARVVVYRRLMVWRQWRRVSTSPPSCGPEWKPRPRRPSTFPRAPVPSRNIPPSGSEWLRPSSGEDRFRPWLSPAPTGSSARSRASWSLSSTGGSR